MVLLTRNDTEDAITIQNILFQNNISQYWGIAALTLLIYDALLTWDKEVEFFWEKLDWSPVTIIYFINRYIGIVGAVSNLFCAFSLWMVNATITIVIVAIDYILYIRVLALFSRRKKLTLYLTILLVVEFVCMLISCFYGSWLQHVYILRLAGGFAFCMTGTLDSFAVISAIVNWAIPVFYGLLLMALALYKAAEYWRLSAGFEGFELVKVVIRDQAVYFLVVIVCSVLNIANFMVPDVAASILFQAGNPYLLSILGNRMFFNLKEAAKRGLNEGTNYHPTTLAAMEFESEETSNAVSGT